MPDIPQKERSITRRTVIASAAFIPFSALALSAQAIPSSFTATHRKALEAFVNRLIPQDQYGPSAVECGVVDYIDRALSDYLAPEKALFLEGLAAVNTFAQMSNGAPLAELPTEKQDEVLIALEGNTVAGFKPDSRAFFNRVRQLTMEGMFGDPFYGGNRAFAGWDLIRYPGPRLAVSPEEQKIRVEIKPVRVSRHGQNMAINLKPVDVAVIGLGAAGGVAVLPLTMAGLKVAGIEAGTWMDPRSFRPDEIHNNIRALVTSVPKATLEMPTLRNGVNQPTRRSAIHPMMNAIGGTSIHYWAQSWRLKPWDFKTRSEIVRRYGAGALPKGSTVEDWPIGYEDLEPYYDIIEHEVGVSGKAGNIQGQIDPAGNVYEAPRQREYPMPPLRATGYSELMADAAKQLGWKPFRPPAAINSQPYHGRPGCVYHGFCNRGGCHIRAKNSTAVTTIPAAMKTKNLTIFDRAQVTRIETGANGKANGVRYIREGKEYFQPARVVMLASYTYENSRLLLLSRSKVHPNGLSNAHGQVGKHYFGHWTTGPVNALFPFDINIWYGTPAQGTSVDDWSDDNYDHAGLGFVGGSNLHAYHEMHPIQAAGGDTFGMAPAWGTRWKEFVHNNSARWATSYIQTSTFPYEDNFLDLDPLTHDPLGDPVCRVTSCPRENETRATEFAQQKMQRWFEKAGAIRTVKIPPGPPGLSTHAYGGTRMGDRPETNVVDRWGFSHEVPNLAILGASVMGTSGSRNPTLTVQALAWRTAEHLAKNWKAIVT